ncbi:hypothetical protein J3F84DRAFT_196532 [Trichoderma pleuroticola]
MQAYSYMHPIYDACPCFLDDRAIEWTHTVLGTCSLSTSTSQLGISSVIFSCLAATSSQVRLFCQSHPLPPRQDSEHPGFSFSRSHSSNRYGDGVFVGHVLKKMAAAKARARSERIVKAAYAYLHCVTKGLQRRACRMSSPGSRVPKALGSHFVVSNRFHDICPSCNLFMLLYWVPTTNGSG